MGCVEVRGKLALSLLEKEYGCSNEPCSFIVKNTADYEAGMVVSSLFDILCIYLHIILKKQQNPKQTDQILATHSQGCKRNL